MKRDECVYLQHILDSIARICQYTQGITEGDFHQQYLVQDGVIRQLEIIGEAARHLSADLKEEYHEVPWQDIVGMRSKLIHDYFGVDIEKVWLTVTDDLPPLQVQIISILEALPD